MPRAYFLWIVFLVVGLFFGCSTGQGSATQDNPDIYLSELSISGISLSPQFSSDQFYYTVLSSDIDSSNPITITTVPKYTNLSVSVYKKTVDGKLLEIIDKEQLGIVDKVFSGNVQSFSTASFGIGEKIDIVVVSEDGTKSNSYSILCLPETFPKINLLFSNKPSPGYFFISTFNLSFKGAINNENTDDFLMIIDNTGVPIWYRQVTGADFKVHQSNILSYAKPEFGVSISHTNEYEFQIVTMDSDYEWTGSWLCAPSTEGMKVVNDGHDSIILENGHVLLIGWIERQRDFSKYGGYDGVIAMDPIVQELDIYGNTVFEWEARDHISYEDITFSDLDFVEGKYDYAHLNSIDIDHNDGNLIVSLRNFNQVFKVARNATTFNNKNYSVGEVIWRLGGPDSDFIFVNDREKRFQHQHTPRILPNGNIILFDNSITHNLKPTGNARFVEYELNFDNMRATLIAQYESNDIILTDDAPNIGNSSPMLGSVQRLNNGNTVIGWGAQAAFSMLQTASITEIDFQLNKVLEIAFEPGVVTYRVFKFNRNEEGSWDNGYLYTE